MIRLSRSTPGITTITLSRPDSLNALNARLVADLSAALTEVARDRTAGSSC